MGLYCGGFRLFSTPFLGFNFFLSRYACNCSKVIPLMSLEILFLISLKVLTVSNSFTILFFVFILHNFVFIPPGVFFQSQVCKPSDPCLSEDIPHFQITHFHKIHSLYNLLFSLHLTKRQAFGKLLIFSQWSTHSPMVDSLLYHSPFITLHSSFLSYIASPSLGK